MKFSHTIGKYLQTELSILRALESLKKFEELLENTDPQTLSFAELATLFKEMPKGTTVREVVLIKMSQIKRTLEEDAIYEELLKSVPKRLRPVSANPASAGLFFCEGRSAILSSYEQIGKGRSASRGKYGLVS